MYVCVDRGWVLAGYGSVTGVMQEKGNGALHVATQANQSSQVELLLVYGADPGSFDAHGRTPADIARFSSCALWTFIYFTVAFDVHIHCRILQYNLGNDQIFYLTTILLIY